jgi:hypothetical protein
MDDSGIVTNLNPAKLGPDDQLEVVGGKTTDTVHVSSRDKRARFRGTLVKVKLSPNRKERIRLAKASVRQFRDELVLAGYDPKKIEKMLARWDGNPKTDPLEALINPGKAERESEIAEAGKKDWLHRFDGVK